MARPVGGGDVVDPFDGQADIAEQTIRAVTDGVFEADPLRLLRAVRLEDELGFRCDDGTEALVRRHASLAGQPAGERILGELERLSAAGFRRLAELGLLEVLGGSDRLFDRIDARRLVRLPARVRVRRPSPLAPDLAEPRPLRAHAASRRASGRVTRAAIHRFRRATEPWATDALAFLGLPELVPAIEEARANDPAAPLLRGDELGLPPGPRSEAARSHRRERAAGTLTTREEALELVRREAR